MATKDELLAREDDAWSAFRDAFASVPDECREIPGVVPDWSVKDMVWHCAYWADYVGTVLERMAQGQPAPDDQDWDALNRAVARESKTMSWDDAIVGARRGRDRARAALLGLPELSEEAERAFAEETFEHYEEHAAEVAAFAEAEQLD